MDKNTGKQRRRREGYTNKSNAICIVAYDVGGKTLSDEVTARIVNAVYEVSEEEKLAISFTRT